MSTRVLVLGGGVGGMTTAHELAERGYSVTVLEARNIPGGKARSYGVPQTGVGGRKDLPAEHGFRFFPGFYKHLPDTMKRIPYESNKQGVFDNLTTASQFMMARTADSDPVFWLKLPSSPKDMFEELKAMFGTDLGVTVNDLAFFTERILGVMCMCQDRRLKELEKQTWWNFIDAANRSEAYQTLLARGMTRSLVALKAEEASARTVADVLIQLQLDFTSGSLDRLLDGPTNEVWIEPWKAYLEKLGVKYLTGSKVKAIRCTDGVIRSVTVERSDGVTEDMESDYYVSSLPVEVLRPLVSDSMKHADPVLDGIRNLRTSWMNGIQFYLKRDVPIVNGHTLFLNSPWALTSVSQAQFWQSKMANYGDGNVKGILSVDISDWGTPGILYNKPARELGSREEIKNEVWAQLKAALNDDLVHELEDGNLVGWHLDDDILLPNPSGAANLEPLLINVANSWQWRPQATTKIPNFFLASDFVQTYTDLATMEGANEAARRAVNGILDATNSEAPRCELWPFEEPAIFKPLKAFDQVRFDLGLPFKGI